MHTSAEATDPRSDPTIEIEQPSVPPIPDQIRAVARAMPHVVAIEDPSGLLSYEALVRESDRLATRLERAGVDHGDRVAIVGARSTTYVIAMIAILDAGGIAVPIDRDIPAPRRQAMCTEAGVRCVVMVEGSPAEAWRPAAPDRTTVEFRHLAGDAPPVTRQERADISQDDPCYIYFTSGSTGTPKGVLGTHKGLSQFIAFHRERFEIQRGDRFALLRSISFDAVMREVFTPLTSGATLIVPPDPLEPDDVLTWLLEQQVTVVHVTPSHADVWLAADTAPDGRSRLRLTVFSGEMLYDTTVERWRQHVSPTSEIVNMYGPTETTMAITYHVIGPEPEQGLQPVGYARPYSQVFVVDGEDRQCGIGVEGEVLLRTPFGTLGYINAPDSEAAAFVANPFTNDADDLVYRSGDLGILREDGSLLIRGRIDDQVQILGVRVEPDEVAAHIRAHPDVDSAVVVSHTENGAVPFLVAFVVMDAGHDPLILRVFLAERLTRVKIPSRFVFLDSLPLDHNGKVDKTALRRFDTHPPGLRPEKLDMADRVAALSNDQRRRLAALLRDRDVDADTHPGDRSDRDKIADRLAALPPAAREAIAARLRARAGSAPDTRDDEAHEARYPLSFAQERLWFLDRFNPGSASYNIRRSVRLRGQLDAKALRKALDGLAARHEVLRTRYVDEEGMPFQVVDPAAPVPLEIVDLRHIDPRHQDRELEDLISRAGGTAYDLAAGPVWRNTLYELGPEDHALVIAIHHIASDGWSFPIITAEISELYSAALHERPPRLDDLPIQYTDYARWQRNRFERGQLDDELAYWSDQFAHDPAPVDLPTDRPRPAVQTTPGIRRPFVVPAPAPDRIVRLAADGAATPFMVGLALFKAFLHRYTGTEDVVVGVASADRSLVKTEPLIGFFVNTLALRTAIDGELTLREVIARIRQTALGAYSNREVPFERVVQHIKPKRDASRSPLFQVMFQYGVGAFRGSLDLEGITEEPIRTRGETSKFDMGVGMTVREGELRGSVVVNSDLFDETTLERMLRHFERFVMGALDDPDKPIGDLSLMDDAERDRILNEFAGTPSDAAEGTVLDRIRAHVASSPRDVAVVSGDDRFSFEELVDRSLSVARTLREVGVVPGGRVAMMMERSGDLVATMFGILWCGAAYVPLEPDGPEERRSIILRDSEPSALVVDDGHGSLSFAGPIVTPSDFDERDPIASGDLDPVDGADAAYVIYTSGTTGTPKGVVVSHSALATLTDAMIGFYDLAPTDRLLQFHSLAFDASVEEVFATLAAGATLVLRSDDMMGSAGRLLRAAAEANITVLSFPTAYWHELTAEVVARDLKIPADVRLVTVGGEAAQPDVVSAWKRRVDSRIRLINGYGPTEVTVTATVTDLTTVADTGVRYTTIGRPLPTVTAYVLDRRMKPVPIGVAGELYLGGPQLADGYFNNPGLTTERYVSDPFHPGNDVYRTGDRARWRPDGLIEFMGRLDGQFKVRGHRIEVGEVESALVGHPLISAAVVTALDNGGSVASLEAYVAAEAPVTPVELQAFLANRVPAYMVPSAIEVRSEIPRLPSGKPDITALRSAPRTLIEQAPDEDATADPLVVDICEIWSEVLDRPVSPNDDFFALGGHSLLAVRLFSRIESRWNTSLPMPVLFTAPTPRRLAEVLRPHVDSAPDSQAKAIPRLGLARAPLSYAQRRLWFLDRLHPGGSAYHVPWGVRLSGPLDRGALQTAFDSVVARHEVLRTRFVIEEGTPSQVIDPPGPVPIRFEDIRALDEDERSKQFSEMVADDKGRPFDLEKDLMLRVLLIRLADEEHGLLVVAHHIATDADSLALLKQDLAHFYATAIGEPTRTLEPLPIQYSDFTVWQAGRVEDDQGPDGLGYWLDKLSAPRPPLQLPVDRRRPADFSYRGDSTGFRVADEATSGLIDLGMAEGATPFMVLVTALVATLHRYTDQTDIIIGSPSTERTILESEGLIGFFVNTVPLRTDVGGDPSFRSLLRRVIDTTLEAFSHRDVPFEAIVEHLQPERDPSRFPIFQVMCALAQGGSSRFRLPGLETSALRAGRSRGTTKFDLTVYGSLNRGRLWVSLGYNTDLFKRDTVEQLGANMGALLEKALGAPDTPLSRLELTAPEERRHLVVELNDTAISFPSGRTIPDVFADVVSSRAEDIALSDDDRSLTYGELETAAQSVADRLTAAGVQPGDAVGLSFARSADLVVAMLGTLTAGCCYVPLDPSYPEPRVAYMASDAGVTAVLSAEDGAIAIAMVEAPTKVFRGAETPAYVMYTSGSSGSPKGVAIPHKAVLRLVCGADYAAIDHSDRVALASNTSFDAVTWEVWSALLNGARLVVIDADTLTSPRALARKIRTDGVTAMFVTTALFNVIARDAPDAFAPLSHLLFGGETVDPRSVAKVLASGRPDRLVHVYGPTESTTFASWHLVEEVAEDATTVPIGLPIANTTLHVLDPSMTPVPPGLPGELHIGGHGLALSYVGDPELTERKFVADPFNPEPGSRLFRTGDIVRRGRDGAIEFLHRADRQVKLRGFRVEPGEIEAHLRGHPMVGDAIVRVWRREGDDRLVAYVVGARSTTLDASEVIKDLRRTLPAYLVPSHVVPLDALPLTSNGKIDHARLPEPAAPEPPAYKRPGTETARRMAELWQGVLGVDLVGSTDNFFDLGGHSLLAVELMAAVESTFGSSIPLSRLFDAPTLSAFADLISHSDVASAADLIVPLRSEGNAPPLFCFHAAGGNVFVYERLAHKLRSGRPVLGIQARGADGRTAPHRSIEDMAAEYFEAIRDIQPVGPYNLLGYSLGGLIAFETARRLEQAGASVGLVGMLDTIYPSRTSWWKRQKRYIRQIRRGGPAGVRDVSSQVWERAKIVVGKMRHGPRWTYYLIRRRPIPPLLASKRLTHIGLAANRTYRPGEYGGTVTYFRASGIDGARNGRSDLPWREASKSVDVRVVPGAHAGEQSLLNEPFVSVLASDLQQALDDLEDKR